MSRTYVRKFHRDNYLESNSPASGSVPIISVTRPTIVNYDKENAVFTQALRSDRTSNNSSTNERSTSEHRPLITSSKPTCPPFLFGSYRAASAENRHAGSNWTNNNSSQDFSKSRNQQPTSPTSLSSSSALSIDESSHQSMFDQKMFDKSLHSGQPHVIARYDFETGVEGDLEFKVGDIIMLEDVVDEYWYRGRSINTNQVGIFPMNHVEVRIPLTSGLFTDTQPKAQNKSVTNKSKTLLNRIHSFQSVKKKPIPTPDMTKSFKSNTYNLNNSNTQIPRRPSRVRVASLCGKYESFDNETNQNSTGQKHGSASQIEGLSNSNPNSYVATLSSRFDSFKLASSAPLDNSTPNRLNFSRKPVFPSPEQTKHYSNCPSLISTLRPRCQTAVSQLAQTLQQQGVIAFRNKPMPTGAKHLYPGSHPLLLSSSPPATERLIITTEMNNAENLPPQNNGAPSGVMVETLLNKLLPELKKNKNSLQHKELTNCSPEPENISKESTLTTDNNSKCKNGYNSIDLTCESNPHLKNSAVYVDNDNFHKINAETKFNDKNNCESVNTDNNNDDKDDATNLSTLRITLDDSQNSQSGEIYYRLPKNDNASDISDIEYSSPVKSAKFIDTHCKPLLKPVKPNKIITSKAFISLTRRRSKSEDTLYKENKKPELMIGSWLITDSEQISSHSLELNLKVGDVVKCIETQPVINSNGGGENNKSNDWIKCETWYGQEGLVQISKLRILTDQNELNKIFQNRPRAQAIYTFTKETDEDLSLNPGDLIYLLELIDENWYKGESATSGNRGMFPATFVQIIQPLN